MREIVNVKQVEQLYGGRSKLNKFRYVWWILLFNFYKNRAVPHECLKRFTKIWSTYSEIKLNIDIMI